MRKSTNNSTEDGMLDAPSLFAQAFEWTNAQALPDADRELFALIEAHRRAKAWLEEDDTEQDEILASAVDSEMAIMARLVRARPRTAAGARALLQCLIELLDPGDSVDCGAEAHYEALRWLSRLLLGAGSAETLPHCLGIPRGAPTFPGRTGGREAAPGL